MLFLRDWQIGKLKKLTQGWERSVVPAWGGDPAAGTPAWGHHQEMGVLAHGEWGNAMSPLKRQLPGVHRLLPWFISLATKRQFTTFRWKPCTKFILLMETHARGCTACCDFYKVSVHSNYALTTFPILDMSPNTQPIQKSITLLFSFFFFPLHFLACTLYSFLWFLTKFVTKINFINQTKCISLEHSTCVILAIRLSMGQKAIHFKVKYLIVAV